MKTATDLFRPEAARRLESSERVLVAGAGGGFDVFAGLPLFFALRALGKTAHLANLSFTYLGGTDAQRLGSCLWRVDHTTRGEEDYFPERYLAEWLHRQGLSSEIHCFRKVGVRPLTEAYSALVDALGVDAIVLVDGGTDILMRGDEAGLGTPAEDMVSLAAARALPLKTKLVTCVAFGVDAFHGVCHAHFLENVAALERTGGYLGAHSLHLSIPEVGLFRDALEYAHQHMPSRQSIVNGSIVSALEGHFGDHHRTDRTHGSELFINPLMALYWHFDLMQVAQRSLYLDRLGATDTIFQVQHLISEFRDTIPWRPHRAIPG